MPNVVDATEIVGLLPLKWKFYWNALSQVILPVTKQFISQFVGTTKPKMLRNHGCSGAIVVRWQYP